MPSSETLVIDYLASSSEVRRKRGPALSRRTGQLGNVYQHTQTRNETNGEWDSTAAAYGRIYVDEPGRRKRLTIQLGVCRSKRHAEAKLSEYITANKINDPATFHRVHSLTFAAKAAAWLESMRNRRRKPVKPATIAGWEHLLEKRLHPRLGNTPVGEIGNAALRTLVAGMAAENLSAKTICAYVAVVKMVVASAVNEEGEAMYPRTWNDDFIGIPIVKKSEQVRQTITADGVVDVILRSPQRERVLFAVLAGTGLRIGEALALKHSDFDGGFRVLRVSRSLWQGKEQDPKTENAVREVDVHPWLASLVSEYASTNRAPYLFTTNSGKPLSQRNVLRSLHAIAPVGLHAFRRFRTEVLRKAGCPEDLIRLWLGHAGASITDAYALGLRDDINWRRQWCERVGVGLQMGDMGDKTDQAVIVDVPVTASLY
jgi:integrase